MQKIYKDGITGAEEKSDCFPLPCVNVERQCGMGMGRGMGMGAIYVDRQYVHIFLTQKQQQGCQGVSTEYQPFGVLDQS